MEYVNEYYDRNYAGGEVDAEVEIVGAFLIKNVYGKVLDCGCGPVPQIWAIMMPQMTKLYAIDLPIESILFVKEKIAAPFAWVQNFLPYVKVVDREFRHAGSDYLMGQIKKIVSVQQADMTKMLPFPENYFDTIVALYSLGVLQNLEELETAISNIKQKLKPGGVFLHINTNGRNTNQNLPEYTWRGLDQSIRQIELLLKKYEFIDIQILKRKCRQNDESDMYTYDYIYLLKARKGL